MSAPAVRYVVLRESRRDGSPRELLSELSQNVIGQAQALETLLLGLIAGGHVLLEGPPGVAKTLSCCALAGACALSFKRIQCTPDLQPSDCTGMRIFDQRTGQFQTQFGPLFANMVLVDELNRAPARIQSTFLEAMGERNVTIGPETHDLPAPFFLVATMNPYDAEGTSPPSQAQVDRFLACVSFDFPARQEELQVLDCPQNPAPLENQLVTKQTIIAWQRAAAEVSLKQELAAYIVDLVRATRPGISSIAQVREYVEHGAGPRASLAFAKLARARAFLHGRACVTAEDMQRIAPLVLRHRIQLQYGARVQGVTIDAVLKELFQAVPL